MKRGISKARAFGYLIFCVIIGVVFLTISFTSFDFAKQPIYDINEIGVTEIKPGMKIRGKAGLIYTAFADYGNEDGVSKQYYAIAAGSGEQFYMALEEEKVNFSMVDDQIDLTWDVIENGGDILGESVYYIEGVVKEMKGELLQYYEEFFVENEVYTQEELQEEYYKNAVPFYIDTTSLYTAGDGSAMLAMGIIMILLGIALFAITFVRIKKQEKELDALTFKMGAASVVTTGMTDNSGSGTAFSDDKKPPMGFE